MAIEIIMREPSSKPMDVYSFAMIAYEIVTLRHPFEEIENLNVIHVLQKVRNGQFPEFPKSTPKAFKKLIERCWAKNPEERPTFNEIVHLLRTDPSFITDNINTDEYYNYIQSLDKYSTNNDKENTDDHITDDDEKLIREQIQIKVEENKYLRQEIEKLKRNLTEEQKKLQYVIEQKEKILSSTSDEESLKD